MACPSPPKRCLSLRRRTIRTYGASCRPSARGLTPSKLASILDQAEQGELVGAIRPLRGHGGKGRPHCRRAGQAPPRAAGGLERGAARYKPGASRKEKQRGLLAELVRTFEKDVLFDVTDAIGKGFSCCGNRVKKTKVYNKCNENKFLLYK